MSSTAGEFKSIPILSYTLLSSEKTRPLFLSQLRHALINVGFLYLSDHPVPSVLIDTLQAHIPQLFELPQEDKDRISMKNSPHFLGYSSLGKELTKGKVDRREQFDIATEMGVEGGCRWKEGRGDPEYWRLWGPSQWPPESLLPTFRENFSAYLKAVESLSYEFASLIAEAFGLGPDGLKQFYDVEENMQHRAKIVQYPVVKDGDDDQGVGPHYDAGFLTFLLQASDHRGLQVQNLAGEWIDAPPIPGTFVINIGKALEIETGGLARATSHRVLSPKDDGTGNPRYSVPFFQNIGLDVRLAESVLEFPAEILELKDQRGEVGVTDSVNFTEFDHEPSGKVNLLGRVKSHPDVAEIHYPELFKRIFPHGYSKSGYGSAY